MIPQYLSFLPTADQETVNRLHSEKQHWVGQKKKGFLKYRKLLQSVAHLQAHSCDFNADIVRIGAQKDISDKERQDFYDVLRAFMPWRKGPFEIFGIEVDSEWQSQRKWNRILPALPDLNNKIIADIGCNNGYYMFRMAAHNPKLVLGFEPYVHHYFAFQMLNSLARQSNLMVDLLGVEHLRHFTDCFDVIFLLGILYHRPSPIDALRDVYEALKPGGTLIVESQAIPGNQQVALFPEKTYAKVPGTWFVPTGACLANWLTRSGFRDVRLFASHPMSGKEQRRTEWMIFESYEDFIDKDNPERTIEGYPSPWRVYLKAEK